MMKTIRQLLAVCLVFMALDAVPAGAQDAAGAQQRMRERVAHIDALKSAGSVGENNRGLLEPRGDLDDRGRELVSAENADRMLAYQEIARRNGTSPDVVGRQRAEQIARRSISGVWLQNPEGEWYRK